MFELPQAYVCEDAVGPDKRCDFRSGRVILQRPVERAQMQKLLATGKTDLLQFVSARTRRPFSAFLVRQPDGKIGFEFEARDPAKAGARRGARGAPAALRVLGKHPKDGQPVELFAGRYGPYVKHGDVNATVRDRDRVDALTLDEALGLLAEKSGREAPRSVKAPRARTAQADGAQGRRAEAWLRRRSSRTGRPKPAPAKPKAVPKTATKATTRAKTKSTGRATAAPKSRAKTAKRR